MSKWLINISAALCVVAVFYTLKAYLFDKYIPLKRSSIVLTLLISAGLLWALAELVNPGSSCIFIR